MKRSEILSKIVSVIINYNEAHCVINRDKAMEMAGTILQVQENAGMMPPNRKAISWSEIGIPNDQTEKPNFTVYMWEPEDE
jgi:hypothetical protein